MTWRKEILGDSPLTEGLIEHRVQPKRSGTEQRRRSKQTKGSEEKTAIPVSEIIEVSTLEDWKKALWRATEAGRCGIDLETTSLDPLSGKVRLVQVALPDGRVYVADMFLPDGAAMLEVMVPFVEDPEVQKVGHNLKFDLAWIGQAATSRLKPQNIFDTMIASQLANAGYYKLVPAPKATKNKFKMEKTSHSLKDLAQRHLGKELDKGLQTSNWAETSLSQEQIRYAAEDAVVLLPLQEILQELLKRNRLQEVAEVEFATISPITEIELAGLPLDIGATMTLLRQKEEETKQLLEVLQACAKAAGFVPRLKKGKKPETTINPNSQMDILDHLQAQGYDITSTKEPVLRELALQGCDFAEQLLHYRRAKRQATFLKDWLLRLSPVDERLHPSYLQLGARSGRITSRNPNGQQIPKRGEDGRKMRRVIEPELGKKLIKADFSGIELRIMARLSRDETMISAFQEGQDLHKLTASKISGVPLDEVTKEQRQGAKAVNFLLIYGGQPPLLQERAKAVYGVEMTLEEAEEAHETFFETYTGVQRWHNGQKRLFRNKEEHWFHSCDRGFYKKFLVKTETVLRRRRIWGTWEYNNLESLATVNQLYNSPSQGTGADLLKLAMAAVYEILPDEAKMIATVHDELLIEVPEDIADLVAEKVKTVMETVGSELLDPVPVEAEVAVVDNWSGDPPSPPDQKLDEALLMHQWGEEDIYEVEEEDTEVLA